MEKTQFAWSLMKITQRILLFYLILLSVSFAGSLNSWRVIGQHGIAYFVHLTNKVDKSDPDLYLKIADSVCVERDRKICQVMFWDNKQMIPSRLPMSDEQVAAQLAHYSWNEHQFYNHMYYNCDVVKKGDYGECL